MAKPWIDSVKRTGKLTVYNGISNGKWTSLFQSGLNEFNQLLKGNGLSLTFEKAASERAANVVVKVSDGPAAYEFEGNSFSQAFNGKGLQGYTGLLSMPDDPKVLKAFVFLPNSPQINTPKGTRPTGLGVMRCILIHEFIHACGLENRDHSSDDVFHGNPQTDYGAKPDDDRVGVQIDGKNVWFPPISLASGTIGKIKALW